MKRLVKSLISWIPAFAGMTMWSGEQNRSSSELYLCELGIKPHHHAIPKSHTKPIRGFTLLEVLIALAVVSIALAALVSAIGTQTRITERLRAKAFAQIVAGNVYNELRLAERWPEVGERDGRNTLAQQRFFWRMAIKTTELPDMRRVEISVLRDADTSTSNAAADPLVSTSAFIINR
jgi:general secretion pathway protein I